MDVLEALRGRRSIGKLNGDVSDEQLRTLIEAATWAPNHRLTEPWRFVVLRGEARVELGRAWAEAAGDEREAGKPLRAPALIVVAVRTDADEVTAIEDFAAAAAATQNLLLAAHALGLGAIWRTGGMAYDPKIKAHLGLDSADRILGIVYVGRPAMTAPKPYPRETERNVRWLG